MNSINWPAVIVAGISSFMVGGLWYARPVFGNTWMKEAALTEEQIKAGNKGKIFGFTFLFSLIMAFNLAMFLQDPAQAGCGPAVNAQWGAIAGFLAGIWTFSAIAIHSLFELKSWKLIFINGGYSLVALTLMGFIIGAWRH